VPRSPWSVANILAISCAAAVWAGAGIAANSGADEARVPAGRVTVRAVVERVSAGGSERSPAVRGDFEPGTSPVAVDFGVSGAAAPPETLRLRYRLLGSGNAWVEAGDHRSVAFFNLAPGEYTFEVSATPFPGPPLAAGTAYAFRIRPHYYETLSFRASASMVALLVVFALADARARGARRRESELRLRVQEATMELEQVNARLEEMATRDDLTGVHNRRYFLEQLDLELRRAARTREPVSLVIADIDVFKALNDTYGHPEGDSALTRVAACMRAAARRPSDCVARIGGEEFAILLPGTGEAGAITFAERVRRDVEALRIPNVNSTVRPSLTISLGVSTATRRPSEDGQVLIAAADRALYRCKAGGRNCIAFEAPPVGPSTAGGPGSGATPTPSVT
jgi:diguanylate cyclase (GGDEF)-like protein